MSYRRFMPRETKAQIQLYHLLIKHGIRYISQEIIKAKDPDGSTDPFFSVDVLIPPILVVEVDGASHYGQRQLEKDIWKNSCLKHAGYTVLRFSDREIWREPDRVINIIKEHLPNAKTKTA